MTEPKRPDDPPPRRVDLHEFQSNMTAILQEARNGRSFLLASHGEILAELRPPSPSSRPFRRPGALRGRIKMMDDFDTLPAEVLAAMEGEEE